MKIVSSFVVVITLVLAVPGTAGAADITQGKTLHEKHCIACHTSLTGGKPDSLYTRADRRVTTLEGLKKQVRRCELTLGLQWFDEEVDNVTGFLNQAFYGFGK